MGFLAVTAIIIFIATSIDEVVAKNKVFNIDDLARESSHAAAAYYAKVRNMCDSEEISKSIITGTSLGQELYDNNQIEIIWKDTDSDTLPDKVETIISGYKQKNFWYKLLGVDEFSISAISEESDIDTPFTLDVFWGGEDAGYTNMIGVYELDENNCVSNPELILANSDDTSLQEGDSLNTTITSPPQYFFIIADGYDTFSSRRDKVNEGDEVSINWCYDDAEGNSLPTVTINGITDTSTNMYFEDIDLNQDEYHHIHSIPESIWDEYNDYINDYNATYDEFIAYADTLNADSDPTNDIDYKDDTNDEYQYAMEDLYNGGDEDFNDIYLNTIKTYEPNEGDTYTINSDGTINLTCN